MRKETIWRRRPDRAKQYTEEKLDQAEKTELDAHFENLLQRADSTRHWTETIVSQAECVLLPNPMTHVGLRNVRSLESIDTRRMHYWQATTVVITHSCLDSRSRHRRRGRRSHHMFCFYIRQPPYELQRACRRRHAYYYIYRICCLHYARAYDSRLISGCRRSKQCLRYFAYAPSFLRCPWDGHGRTNHHCWGVAAM